MVIANFFGPEPSVTYKTGNGVLLDAEGRHHESVNHIISRGDDAHFFVDRYHHRVVDLEQVVVHDHPGFGAAIVGQLTMGRVERRNETNALALALDVVITPFPLHACGLDGEVGVGCVLHGHHHLGGRQGHQDHDDEGHDGPDDFNRDRFMEVGRLVTDRLAVFPDRIKHDREHREKNHGTQDQHEPVQPGLLFGDFGHGGVQI